MVHGVRDQKLLLCQHWLEIGKILKRKQSYLSKMYDLVHLVHSKTKNEHSSIVVRMNVEKEVL